jgi:tetratricopeptide (TPR) repeat protein
MRSFLIAITGLFVCRGCSLVQAGIYIPGKSPEIVVMDGKAQAMPFDQFRLVFSNTVSVAAGKPSELRSEYEKQRDQLLMKGLDQLDESEFATLSGSQIRLRQLNNALAVLQTARGKFPRSFLVQCHLAMVFHLLGQPDAPGYELDAISLLPKKIPGMEAEQTDWAKRLERVFYNLEKARYREQKEKGPRAALDTLDPIFPVTFVGESGQYEAGKIAAEEKKKLPDDAIAVVQQLLLWLPEDTRLYWLLGELYNADGNINAAATIFTECVDARRFQPELLREHRRVVLDAAAAAKSSAGFGNMADRFGNGDKSAAKGSSWREHPEAFVIVGSIVAVPLLFLIFWQIRVLVRRAGTQGECRTDT